MVAKKTQKKPLKSTKTKRGKHDAYFELDHSFSSDSIETDQAVVKCNTCSFESHSVYVMEASILVYAHIKSNEPPFGYADLIKNKGK